jgi:acetyl-CoA carboxylase carboxyl transferase subunit beta
MSWLSRLLPPKVQIDNNVKSGVPEGLWQKCHSCNEILYHTDLDNNLKVCPKCNYHHSLTARERLMMLLETDGMVEIATEVMPVDLLKFKDNQQYSKRLKAAQDKTNENDALIVAKGLIEDQLVVVAVFEFAFIGGSMGSVVGEKFVRGVNSAIENKCPFICVSSSGGARMQEGLTSLMQMAKTCASLTLLNEQKLPFISVLANPTMGGVSASFAFLGDVVLAESGALIGFAGQRVIEQTVRQKLPDGFQTAEFLVDKGALDFVVQRQEMKTTIYNIIKALLNK